MPTHPFTLDGQIVLVTGASSGIGRATAKLLATLGARVICSGRDAERLQETLTALPGAGHLIRPADVDDAEAFSRLLPDLAREVGPLAGVVHAAGALRPVPLRIAKANDFLSSYRTNSLSAGLLLAAIARRGVARTEGCSVVLVGSTMSVLGAAGLSAYCASKAALVGLAKAAALELASAKIRVNAVLPGMVDTPMSQQHRAALSPEQVQAIEAMHPLGLGQPEDVAHAVAFLLADAARWITGSCLVVDGGYSAQ